MAMVKRVAGNEEGNGGKIDGNDEKGGRRATVMVATRVAGDKEGNGEGRESDGDCDKEGDGEEEGKGICNSVFCAPKRCVESTQKKRSHIWAIANHKSQNKLQ